MPDFFHGERADLAWFPPDTEEKKAALFGFINTKAAVAEKVGVLRRVAEDARVRFGGVRSWGAVGLCWGGKVSILFPFIQSWRYMGDADMGLVGYCTGLRAEFAVCCDGTGASWVCFFFPLGLLGSWM